MTKTYIRVKNWDEYQHYKDRHAPWIKFYGNMLTSEWWIMGSDDSKLLAICIMALAQRNDNKIPADIEYIKRFSHISSTPDIQALIDSQFIELIDENDVVQVASKELDKGKQSAPRGEKNRGDKKEGAARFDFLKALVDKGVDPQVASDYITTRKAKKCVQTETAFKSLNDESVKAGLSVPDAVAICCKRGWGGFEASWIKPEDRPVSATPGYVMPDFMRGAL